MGIEYGSATRGAESLLPPLHYPVFAAWAEDGRTLIVDELGIEKSLRVADGRNGRVLEVAASGEVLRRLATAYSSTAGGLVVETDWDGRVFRTIGEERSPVMLSDLAARKRLDPRL